MATKKATVYKSAFDKLLEKRLLALEKTVTEPLPSSGAPFGVHVWEHGIHPDNTSEENSAAWEALIATFPLGWTATVYFPTGHYHFARTLYLDAKPLHLKGDNGSIFTPFGTRFIFPEGQTGIHVKRKAGNYQEAIIEDICLVASGSRTIPWASGINANGRVRIIRCSAKNFSHNGFDLWGNLESEGSDVSGSYLFGCHSLENGNDGFFVGKMDGNCVAFFSCDARDNGRHGFNDDSFLGVAFYSCMAHYNKEGDFYQRDGMNGRTAIYSGYSEGGNTPSQLGDSVLSIGGTWGSPFQPWGKPPMTGNYIHRAVETNR